jgi:chemotaxis response regulator CheB
MMTQAKSAPHALEALTLTSSPALSLVRTPEPAPDGRFPVVGIGCSAGGLEALQAFLANVPVHSV